MTEFQVEENQPIVEWADLAADIRLSLKDEEDSRPKAQVQPASSPASSASSVASTAERIQPQIVSAVDSRCLWLLKQLKKCRDITWRAVLMRPSLLASQQWPLPPHPQPETHLHCITWRTMRIAVDTSVSSRSSLLCVWNQRQRHCLI